MDVDAGGIAAEVGALVGAGACAAGANGLCVAAVCGVGVTSATPEGEDADENQGCGTDRGAGYAYFGAGREALGSSCVRCGCSRLQGDGRAWPEGARHGGGGSGVEEDAFWLSGGDGRLAPVDCGSWCCGGWSARGGSLVLFLLRRCRLRSLRLLLFRRCALRFLLYILHASHHVRLRLLRLLACPRLARLLTRPRLLFYIIPSSNLITIRSPSLRWLSSFPTLSSRSTRLRRLCALHCRLCSRRLRQISSHVVDLNHGSPQIHRRDSLPRKRTRHLEGIQITPGQSLARHCVEARFSGNLVACLEPAVCTAGVPLGTASVRR